MGENCLEAGQDILVVHILAFNRGVGCVIRVFFAGLQAVGHLTIRSSMSGCLEIDPCAAGVVGLEIRIHGGCGNDRRVRIGGQGKGCAEHEHNAGQHSDASAPFGFENWQSPPVNSFWGKERLADGTTSFPRRIALADGGHAAGSKGTRGKIAVPIFAVRSVPAAAPALRMWAVFAAVIVV